VHKSNATTQRGISQLQALTHPVTLPDSQSLQTQRSASQGNVNLPALGERTEKKKARPAYHGPRLTGVFLFCRVRDGLSRAYHRLVGSSDDRSSGGCGMRTKGLNNKDLWL